MSMIYNDKQERKKSIRKVGIWTIQSISKKIKLFIEYWMRIKRWDEFDDYLYGPPIFP